MKDIFEKIKDREWDWFEENEPFKTNIYGGDKHGYTLSFSTGVSYSLADLLANKSWCKAVWHKPQLRCRDDWEMQSQHSFMVLQRFGEKECIKYIKQTMV